ncbi:hypothetical protein C8J57DRAFT_1728061 [Mycena rebaudengoi]|nr:hypothetical protein C8J57DRAFT_1728061 [Mycena rebaudengoi]
MVWSTKDKFFEKHDFCRVMKNAALSLGHYGECCPETDLARTFTLVDCNGIHATAIAFCRCKTADGARGAPEFLQLLCAGIFPGSIKEPKTGYTLNLLEYYRQQRNQGKGSAYNFVRVLQRTADPHFAGAVPDIYGNFLAITRFHQHLDVIMKRGFAYDIEVALPGKSARPYPNRPRGYLGLNCVACPERGVNMPFVVNVPTYQRHLISMHTTLDGNFKANLFFKRDDGSDIALTDGNMYFPPQEEFERLAKQFVVKEEDKEVPCKAHIGSIHHQGSVKYGNTAVSGVIGAACDHSVAGSFVDMLIGEAFAIGTYAQHEMLRHRNTPPHNPESKTPTMFPEATWLHDLLRKVEGQIPADRINGHGEDCKTIWQSVYFACRAHFHGETAEVLWAFLNPLGSSTRQSTGAARHDIINFVIDGWNTGKVLRQAELLADERRDALRLFELHMAVLEDLSRQHSIEVTAWSRLSRVAVKIGNKWRSVYQHESTKVLTIDNILNSMVTEEHKKSVSRARDTDETTTSVAKWIHDCMRIERNQVFAIALLDNHCGHLLQETWDTITKLHDTLNVNLKKFREQQRTIYPRLKLSGLDVDEPELTAIQLPSYCMKQRTVGVDATAEDVELWEAETKLRCGEASSGILAVREASWALSAAGLIKKFEIEMYNHARNALIHLGYMKHDADEPYPPLTMRDTRRKDTHLHRAKGDSRLFDGTAWYLQSGVTISQAALSSTLAPIDGKHSSDEDDDEPTLLVGTQGLKRSGFKKSSRAPKRFKDIIIPDDVVVDMSEAEESDIEKTPTGTPSKPQPRKKKPKKSDGWIWLEKVTRGHIVSDDKLADYKTESDRVQWFRAEAEMYRWLELYERKHAELFRVIARFARDKVVWQGLAGRATERGAINYAHMQAAMSGRLEHNATVTFKTAESGAHHDWVSATSFDDLATKIDGWRDAVFKWMDDKGIHRAYKDF